MPEEINRVLTDQVSDLLFTPSADADDNLRREGIETQRIHRVGNVMIDTLVRLIPQAAMPASSRMQAVSCSRPFIAPPMWTICLGSGNAGHAHRSQSRRPSAVSCPSRTASG